ncbi:MAG TPA: hypothetical protein VED16_00435, partial [Candidatus Acidoferrum sp.]|nr:hypothetical protein [Candidatus Acidoferrum sp.]
MIDFRPSSLLEYIGNKAKALSLLYPCVSWMQFFGHTWRQTPQASQTLSSTAKDLPPCTLYVFFVVAGLSTANSSALTGQATTQLLHPVQLLSMCNANVTYFTSLILGN